MKILITGGLGYLGGRLAAHLQRIGHECILGTRSQTDCYGSKSEFNIVNTIWDSEEDLRKICHGVDAIVHAAGMNAGDCRKDPINAQKFNGMSTKMLALAATLENVEKFVYLSTCHVYADPLSGLLTEESKPNNTHPYATSKIKGELAVLEFGETGRLQSTVLRISNSFGPPAGFNKSCWQLFVNELCRDAVTKDEIVIKSDPGIHRDFISMTEVCTGIAAVLNNENANGIFNLSAGVSHTLQDVANIVRSRCMAIIGREPIIRQLEIANQNPQIYLSNRKLVKYVCAISSELTAEIDEILKYCQIENHAQ